MRESVPEMDRLGSRIPFGVPEWPDLGVVHAEEVSLLRATWARFGTAQIERELPPLREMEKQFDRFFGRDTLQGRLSEPELQRGVLLERLGIIDRLIGGAKGVADAQLAT